MNTRKRILESKKIEDEESETSSSILLSESSESEESEESEKSSESNMETKKTQIQTQPQNQYRTFIVSSAINTTYIMYDTTKIYLLWILLHYIASQIYAPICSPYSFWGFIIAPILAVTPQCRALRWIINTGGNTMETMWVILGAWFCSKIILPYTSMSLKPRFTNNRERAKSYDHINEHNQVD